RPGLVTGPWGWRLTQGRRGENVVGRRQMLDLKAEGSHVLEFSGDQTAARARCKAVLGSRHGLGRRHDVLPNLPHEDLEGVSLSCDRVVARARLRRTGKGQAQGSEHEHPRVKRESRHVSLRRVTWDENRIWRPCSTLSVEARFKSRLPATLQAAASSRL